MTNLLGPLFYSDIEVVSAYQWIKQQITADLKAGKDVEKYRTPLKEIGTELNYRLQATICHIDDLLAK